MPYPIEYKRSRDKVGSKAYRIQLCAHALCLEEMMDVPVRVGAVYEGQTRRRYEVDFNEELRSLVESGAARMHELFRKGVTPPPEFDERCGKCSMEPVCLPKAVSMRSGARWVVRQLEVE